MTFWIYAYLLVSLVVGILGHYNISKPAIDVIIRFYPGSMYAALPNLTKFLCFGTWFLFSPIFFYPVNSNSMCEHIKDVVIDTLRKHV